MTNLKIFCVSNIASKDLELLEITLAGVGKNKFPNNYIICDKGLNIQSKEKYYSELTFQYWYWKNLLNLEKKEWVGFCQKRRFWIKKNSKITDISKSNIKENLLTESYESWKSYDSIICNPINISGAKKIKIIKRGWKNLLKDPFILFNKDKENIALHFDMHHGYGNLDLAIEEVQDQDKKEFKKFVYTENSFNPHIMFIAKKKITNDWFNTLFPWLERCEKKFGFKKLHGYDTTRLYAYLAERYLSFWFKKYTKYLESSWIFFDNS